MLPVPKYPRTMHHPSSPGLQNDDRVSEYPDDILGREVIITEKIDGGNTGLYNGEVYARSTGQPSTAGWFAMVRKHHAWKTLGDLTYVYHGEDIYGQHSIEYDAIPESETYMLFNIRRISAQPALGWLSWDDVVATADQMNIPTVPVLFRGVFNTQKELTNWFNDQIGLPSRLGGDREGFVVRAAEFIPEDQFSRLVQKYVRKNHVQTDQHWKMNWQPCKLKKD